MTRRIRAFWVSLGVPLVGEMPACLVSLVPEEQLIHQSSDHESRAYEEFSCS